MRLPLDLFCDQNLVFAVNFSQQHLYVLPLGRRNILSHVVRPNGQLSMSPVHKNRELNRFWSTQVHQGIEGSPHRSPRIEDIIDEDQTSIGYIEGDFRLPD